LASILSIDDVFDTEDPGNGSDTSVSGWVLSRLFMGMVSMSSTDK
jgi:hypothetical protein